MTETPSIRLRDVHKSYGNTTAVESLDLTVPPGTIYGLLGPNGAGKTTTIRMILDILGPDRGTVEVLGRKVDDSVRQRVGYLPEERGLYPKMKVIDHLVFFGELKRLPRDVARERGMEWLERVGLADRAEESVEDFSKGMQQKVQFVSTVLHEPELLILDEPFSGLDPINVDLLKDIVLEQARRGTTILFSTHLIEDAERLCDRVCMIAHAQKVLDGTVAEVKKGTGRRHVSIAFDGPRDFLDNPGIIQSLTDQGRHVEITLEPDGDPQELLKAAVADGVRIERFQVAEPTLREIFLERAGRKGIAVESEEVEPAGLVSDEPEERAAG